MRVALVIDCLASGGAQRQMTLLAILLHSRGCQVHLFIYYPLLFYASNLERAGVPITVVESKSRWLRPLAIRKAIRSFDPDVAIAYLDGPNLWLELSRLPFGRFGVVVSERNNNSRFTGIRDTLRFQCHRFADVVVANSQSVRSFVVKRAPWLSTKCEVIYNCVDMEQFSPDPRNSAVMSDNVVVLGRFQPQKNPLGLIRALEVVQRKHPRSKIRIDWFGSNFFQDGAPTDLSGHFFQVESALADSSLASRFQIHDPIQDVVGCYHSAGAVCMPSFYEGCSNVVCEALACGKPILVSDIPDNDHLVIDGQNGFRFDPSSPDSIADALLKFEELPEHRRVEMGQKSRSIAEQLLGTKRFADQYCEILQRIRR